MRVFNNCKKTHFYTEEMHTDQLDANKKVIAFFFPAS